MQLELTSTHQKVVSRRGAEFLEEEQYGHDQSQRRPVGLGPAHTLRRQFHVELGFGTPLSDGTIFQATTFTYHAAKDLFISQQSTFRPRQLFN